MAKLAVGIAEITNAIAEITNAIAEITNEFAEITNELAFAERLVEKPAVGLTLSLRRRASP
ncbi:MAG: hypothetical protein ACYTXY_36735 [Nostoc sp.]